MRLPTRIARVLLLLLGVITLSLRSTGSGSAPASPLACDAEFEWEQLPNSLTIHFINQSTSDGEITSYQWNFGDGHMGDGQNPNHTYENPGVYQVCLIIHDNMGCVSDVCHEVVVEAPPAGECNAAFTWEQVPNSLVIHFINQSTSDGEITSYQWNFGDGHTGDGQNPNHTYTEPGVYVVCLIIHDNMGCVSDVCHEVTVEAPPAGECNAAFTWEQVPNTLTIHFINQSTSDGEITSYQWNFGDGHTGDGQNPNHTYAESGVYVVCLIIHDNMGCVSDVCHEVVVEALPAGECEAAFTWEQVPNTLTIHFINQSTSDGEITSYQWTFGDGHSGDGQNPNHTYAEPGVYVVCLTIHDNMGCVSDVCHEVVVEAASGGCNAAFEWEQLPNSLTIHFINQSTSSGEITSYQWNFGDGHMGDGQNPNHTYAEPGVYLVCLIIHDNMGCVSDICHEVVVEAPGSGECNAAFAWEQVPNSLTIHFINQSTSDGEITSYQWNFGDGHMGDGQNPHHTYAEPGVYLVCLIIHDNMGCVSDVCHEVVVEAPGSGECNAAFAWEQVPNSLTIHFINQSTSDGEITSYLWNFGDGHMGDGQNPHHTYAEPGVYLVCLIIHDNMGCVSDVCHEVVVEAPGSGECNAAFTWEQDPDTLTVYFINQSTSDGEIISYQWTFGDGHTGDGENPHHTYAEPGVYLVCLVIHDNQGCVSDVCHEVAVNETEDLQCQAGFEASQSVKHPLTMDFTDHSTGETAIGSWYWIFGDKAFATIQNPSHTYQHAGEYLVCLEVTNENEDCVSTTCRTVRVKRAITAQGLPKPGPVILPPPAHSLTIEDTDGTIEIFSVFPNPVSEMVTFAYALKRDAQVSLLLYSAVGEQLVRICDKDQQAGSHEIQYNANVLPAGVYQVQLIADHESIVRQVVIVK